MNGTGKRGGAFGFQLYSLEKVNQLKSNKVRSYTMLAYIIDRLEEKQEEGVNFIDVK